MSSMDNRIIDYQYFATVLMSIHETTVSFLASNTIRCLHLLPTKNIGQYKFWKSEDLRNETQDSLNLGKFSMLRDFAEEFSF